MPEHLTQEDIIAWLEAHGQYNVYSVELDLDTLKNGCMRVVKYAVDEKGHYMAGRDMALMDEVIVKIRHMPGQETLWDEST